MKILFALNLIICLLTLFFYAHNETLGLLSQFILGAFQIIYALYLLDFVKRYNTKLKRAYGYYWFALAIWILCTLIFGSEEGFLIVFQIIPILIALYFSIISCLFLNSKKNENTI